MAGGHAIERALVLFPNLCSGYGHCWGVESALPRGYEAGTKRGICKDIPPPCLHRGEGGLFLHLGLLHAGWDWGISRIYGRDFFGKLLQRGLGLQRLIDKLLMLRQSHVPVLPHGKGIEIQHIDLVYF